MENSNTFFLIIISKKGQLAIAITNNKVFMIVMISITGKRHNIVSFQHHNIQCSILLKYCRPYLTQGI